MRITLVAAVDRALGIGKDNRLPWRLPDDLKHFKALTLGGLLLMGRKTWESLPGPLPGRDSLVLSRDPAFQVTAPAIVVTSWEQALALARSRGAAQLLVVGGATLYAHALGQADRLYLTEVDTVAEADAHFPTIDRHEWREIERVAHSADARHRHAFCFVTLERIMPARRD